MKNFPLIRSLFGYAILSAWWVVNASPLWISKRDRAADIEAIIKADRAVFSHARPDQLSRIKAELKNCLGAKGSLFVAQVISKTENELKLRRWSDDFDSSDSINRKKRSLDEHIFKRDPSGDTEEIIKDIRVILNSWTDDQINGFKPFVEHLSTIPADGERQFMDRFIELASKCFQGVLRREFLADSDEFDGWKK